MMLRQLPHTPLLPQVRFMLSLSSAEELRLGAAREHPEAGAGAGAAAAAARRRDAVPVAAAAVGHAREHRAVARDAAGREHLHGRGPGAGPAGDTAGLVNLDVRRAHLGPPAPRPLVVAAGADAADPAGRGPVDAADAVRQPRLATRSRARLGAAVGLEGVEWRAGAAHVRRAPVVKAGAPEVLVVPRAVAEHAVRRRE
eukprot:CAMPEP_0118853180 /NCGR_PEP_ID=MMETSP1163-20130328/1841_1 /TAXON_ID=124430 /ORGANISM="Phaeomonas parva, Strain CCMP2877" /LENGTH=198 /DNA_ID=CAMNT_0006785689 /DNA_START=386 /DNA_END=979 /DNA_ORIENTATION=-